MNFKFTNISLNKVYKTGYEHALKNIVENGGKIGEDDVTIKFIPPVAVKFEKSFPNLYPVERKKVIWDTTSKQESNFRFEGTGFVIAGYLESKETDTSDYIAKLEITIDSLKVDEVSLPKNYKTRKADVYWNYELAKQTHNVQVKWLNPVKGEHIRIEDVIIYSDVRNK